MDLPDALVEERGRAPAAEVLGANYRTEARCQRSRQAPRRMRQALLEYPEQQDFRNVPADEPDVAPGAGGGRGTAGGQGNRFGAREQGIAGTVEAQTEEWEVLWRRVAELKELGYPQSGGAGILGGQELEAEWRQPSRGHGMPDARVVSMEPQPDESRAFGLAAQLVAQWQEASPSDSGSGFWNLRSPPVSPMEPISRHFGGRPLRRNER